MLFMSSSCLLVSCYNTTISYFNTACLYYCVPAGSGRRLRAAYFVNCACCVCAVCACCLFSQLMRLCCCLLLFRRVVVVVVGLTAEVVVFVLVQQTSSTKHSTDTAGTQQIHTTLAAEDTQASRGHALWYPAVCCLVPVLWLLRSCCCVSKRKKSRNKQQQAVNDTSSTRHFADTTSSTHTALLVEDTQEDVQMTRTIIVLAGVSLVRYWFDVAGLYRHLYATRTRDTQIMFFVFCICPPHFQYEYIPS